MSDLGDWVEFWSSGSGIFDFDGDLGIRGHDIFSLMEIWVFGVPGTGPKS